LDGFVDQVHVVNVRVLRAAVENDGVVEEIADCQVGAGDAINAITDPDPVARPRNSAAPSPARSVLTLTTVPVGAASSGAGRAGRAYELAETRSARRQTRIRRRMS